MEHANQITSEQTVAQDNALTGMLVGLALGDALGMPLEFKQRGSFSPISDMEEGGPFGLPKGFWTDDTSMALCMADSFISQGGYDSYDIMQRFADWQYRGYRSSTGVCFDVGNQISAAIGQFVRQPTIAKTVQRNNTPGQGAGNGAIMRLAPVIMAGFDAFAGDPRQLFAMARMSARETHFNEEAEQLTWVFASMLAPLCQGLPKHRIFTYAGEWPIEQGSIRRLLEAKDLNTDALKPTGYALDTMEVAVWAFLNSSSFAEGALMAVNLGGDADTIGAVYGQLAGAYYGHSFGRYDNQLPADWLAVLHEKTEIEQLATQLIALRDFKILRTRFEEDADKGWFERR